MRANYWQSIQPLVEKCLAHNQSAMKKASAEIFDSLGAGGVWHLFGSGHSSLRVEEAFHRAGGLVAVNPLTVVELSPLVNPAKNREAERSEGLTPKILQNHSVQKNEVIWIISNSGINPASVDIAIAAKAMGMRVWAITCVEHSLAANSRHSSGKRLFEVADSVLDTLLPPGDAILEISGAENSSYQSGAASLVVGSVLLHSVEELVIEKFVELGLVPPVYRSSNLPGGDEHNKSLEARYENRVMRMRE